MNELRVAIIGFGGIARVHNKAYAELVRLGVPVRIVAICEKNLERVKASLNFNLGVDDTPLPEGVHLYSDMDELIANEQFDIADVCLPSFLHRDVSVKFLSAGKHVLCEKPMALRSSDCEDMVMAARAAGRELMIGQCVRFIPAYTFVKECIEDGRYGKLYNLYLDRHSIYPTWGADNIFSNTDKCGGCMMDMHIHDVDIARFFLGEPKYVSSVAYDKAPVCQVVTSTLYYDDATVVASASWDSALDTTFRASYRARFENASLIYNGDGVTVITNDGSRYDAKLDPTDYMVAEIGYFLDTVAGGRENIKNSASSAMQSVRMIEKIKDSAMSGGDKLPVRRHVGEWSSYL